MTELSESVIEQVDKRAKLETELLPLLEEQEALQSKTIFSGQIRNRQEFQRLQDCLD